MELLIGPDHAEKNYWYDLWHYRDLFHVLARRDIAVRYSQTVIGIAWAVIRPLLTTLVFTVIFGRIGKFPAPGRVPYTLLVYAGMLPWQFFSTALSETSISLISNSNLVSKIYFPRLIVPAATVMVAFVDFLISFVLLVPMMIWFGVVPNWHVCFLPFFVALTFLASFGPGLWIAAVNVKYRDFRYVVPFLVQFGLYVSPVAFMSSMVPEKWRLLYSLNPIVGIVDGFRWCLLGGEFPAPRSSLLLSVAVTSLLLWLGIRKFRQMEKSFADII